MKTCISCGAQCDDSMNFCNKCGTPFAAPQAAEVVAPVTNMADEATVGVNDFMPPVAENVVEAPVVEAPQEFANVSFAPQPEAPKKKSKKGLIIGIIVAVVVLLGAAVAGYFTDWFGLAKEEEKKEDKKPAATQKVHKSAGVFTEISEAMTNTFLADNLSIKGDFEMAGQNMTMLDGRVVFDEEAQDIIMLMETMGSSMMLYEGKMYTHMVDGTGSIEETDSYEEAMETFFKAREEALSGDKKMDIAALLAEMSEGDKAEMSEYVDPDKLEDFINDATKNYFDNEEWLKEYMGFKKSSNTYSFKIDADKFCDEIIRIVNESDAFTDEAKEEFEAGVDESIRAALSESGIEEFSITLKDGYIEAISITVNAEGMETTITITFFDINNTEISSGEIEEMQANTEQAIEDSTCADCGEVMYDPEFHGDCVECGEHGDLWDDGLCDECSGVAA